MYQREFEGSPSARTHRVAPDYRRIVLTPEQEQELLARIVHGSSAKLRATRLARVRRRAGELAATTKIDVEGARWSVARVFSGLEREVADDLEAMGFRVYCPLRRFEVLRGRVRGKTKRERKVRERPLFPGYLFVGAPGAGEFATHAHEKIIDVFGNGPNQMRRLAKLITAVNVREIAGDFDDAARAAAFRATPFDLGSTVRVLDGPFREFLGIVSALPGDLKVQIEIMIFGRRTPAMMGSGQLEPV